jgi:hypothetical protein
MSEKERDFPNHLVFYFVLFMAFFARSSYEAIIEKLTAALDLISSSDNNRVLNKSSISRGRERVGWEPFALVYSKVVKPIATQETKGAWFRGLRSVILDGVSFRTADTVENAKEFGYPENHKGGGAFPNVPAVILAESGTHVAFGISIGNKKRKGELELATDLLPLVKKGMLLLCDRFYPSYDFLKLVKATGAHVLWRVKSDFKLEPEKRLPDGSYLSRLHQYKNHGGHRTGKSIPVRVIQYKLKGKPSEQYYRVITTILDPDLAEALDIGAHYHERWEVENVNDELKVHLKAPDLPLRSKSPDMVRQEIYGYLLAHFVVRDSIHHAALSLDEDPDKLSFLGAVEVIKERLPQAGVFSP